MAGGQHPATRSIRRLMNTVPSALVKRVEVLTGGASAIYGSDAVSGAVNFILDTNFTGFKLDLDGAVNRGSNDRGELQAIGRSEERRVGKECRSRWSPYH